MTATNILVSPEVMATLPKVLIDWFCKLVTSEKFRNSPVQMFTLAPGELGGQSIQNIRHAGEQRRLFGFPPIRCKLLIWGCSDQYQMVLAN